MGRDRVGGDVMGVWSTSVVDYREGIKGECCGGGGEMRFEEGKRE